MVQYENQPVYTKEGLLGARSDPQARYSLTTAGDIEAAIDEPLCALFEILLLFLKQIPNV